MTNVLDLVVWFCIQCEVAKLHKDKRHNPDELAATCEEAFASVKESTLTYGFDKLADVAEEILENAGECDLKVRMEG